MISVAKRKLLYIVLGIAPAIILAGISIVGAQAIRFIFSNPSVGLIGIFSLLSLVTLSASFFVTISLPIVSASGRRIGVTVVGIGLILLFLFLAFAWPALGNILLISSIALAGIAIALIAEIAYTSNNSFQG